MYKAMQNVKEGRPGEETIIKEELDADANNYLLTFNGDKAELERRLRREAETIANSDTFMYFKDKIDNLPEYVKTGDPQLLDENSSLRYIDDLRKDIETDVRQTYGNSSFGAYDPNSQPPEREEIAKQLFEEYKNAGTSRIRSAGRKLWKWPMQSRENRRTLLCGGECMAARSSSSPGRRSRTGCRARDPVRL